jgi:hypothetical protein
VLNSTFAHNGASRGSAIFGEYDSDVMTTTLSNNDQYSGSEGPDASIHGVSLAYTLISERDVEAYGFGVEDRSYNIENGDS